MQNIIIILVTLFLSLNTVTAAFGDTQHKTEKEKYFSQGEELSAAGKYEEAIKAYDKAIELNPDDAEAYYNKGIGLLKKI